MQRIINQKDCIIASKTKQVHELIQQIHQVKYYLPFSKSLYIHVSVIEMFIAYMYMSACHALKTHRLEFMLKDLIQLPVRYSLTQDSILQKSIKWAAAFSNLARVQCFGSYSALAIMKRVIGRWNRVISL